MSLVPEIIIQTTLVRGIKAMRNNASYIDQLFRNLDQNSLDQVRKFVKKEGFDLCFNYPRTTLKVPAIVILLKAEKENQAFLGDALGYEYPEEFSYDLNSYSPQGTASTTNLSGNYKVVYGPATALTGTENTLRVEERIWVIDQFLQEELKLRIVSGTGKGQIRNIIGNSSTIIMVDNDWLTVPDNTSVFEVVEASPEVLGEPASLYERQIPTTVERRGGLYDITYQLQVVGPNPELTIYLSIILKAILTRNRYFLERQGVINFKLSTSDFTSRPDYLPDLAYMRAINMDFIYHYDIFENQTPVRHFRITLEGQDDSITGVPILSTTSFDIDSQGNVMSETSDVQRLYFGVATPPITYDANFAQNTIGNQGTAISSQRQRFINFTTGPGQKMYYVYPASYNGGPANFIDTGTGFEIGFIIAATILLTTAYGIENFYIWESEQASLGFVAAEIT